MNRLKSEDVKYTGNHFLTQAVIYFRDDLQNNSKRSLNDSSTVSKTVSISSIMFVVPSLLILKTKGLQVFLLVLNE